MWSTIHRLQEPHVGRIYMRMHQEAIWTIITAPKGPFSLLLLIFTAHKFDWPLAVPLQVTPDGMAISRLFNSVSICYSIKTR